MLAILPLDSSVTALELHRDSGLLAVTCDDLASRLVDIETRRVVRELRGFKGRILDVVCSSFGIVATAAHSADILARFKMVDCDIPRFHDSNIRYPHWSFGRCIPYKLDCYQCDLLSYWRFLSYSPCRQSGCSSLVRLHPHRYDPSSRGHS